MTQLTPAIYRQELSAVKNGSLILLLAGIDHVTTPAIKGEFEDEASATLLTHSFKRHTGEKVNGPVTLFGNDAECLVLGNEVVIDYDPITVEFRPDGNWSLGRLSVDTNGRWFIHSHSTKKGKTFVAIDNGGIGNRGPVATFSNWSLSIVRADGTTQELFRWG